MPIINESKSKTLYRASYAHNHVIYTYMYTLPECVRFYSPGHTTSITYEWVYIYSLAGSNNVATEHQWDVGGQTGTSGYRRSHHTKQTSKHSLIVLLEVEHIISNFMLMEIESARVRESIPFRCLNRAFRYTNSRSLPYSSSICHFGPPN